MSSNIDHEVTSEDRVGPGCFVKVGAGAHCFWAEVNSRDGDRITGIVHQELATSECRNSLRNRTVIFKHGQIRDYGCGRYCWC